jgi:hypothetical protein
MDAVAPTKKPAKTAVQGGTHIRSVHAQPEHHAIMPRYAERFVVFETASPHVPD